MRQDMCDRRCGTGGEAQEAWDRRRETGDWRHERQEIRTFLLLVKKSKARILEKFRSVAQFIDVPNFSVLNVGRWG